MGKDTAALAAMSGKLLEAVSRARPLVQNITNFVSMDIAANALLAIGASPAMVHAPEESPEFSKFINALVINIGTLSAVAADSMEVAAQAAQRNKKPWLLDPVGAGGLTQFFKAVFNASFAQHLAPFARQALGGAAREADQYQHGNAFA